MSAPVQQPAYRPGGLRIAGVVIMLFVALVAGLIQWWLQLALAILSIAAAIAPLLYRLAQGGGLSWAAAARPELRVWSGPLALAFAAATPLTFVITDMNTPEARARMAQLDQQRRIEEAREERLEGRQERLEAGEEQLQARAEQAARIQERRKGMHCLNDIDGSHWEMQAAIKAQLRDPESFEVVETAITPVDAKGQHRVIMTYRARNGFGGMNIERAIGGVDSTSCKLAELVVL